MSHRIPLVALTCALLAACSPGDFLSSTDEQAPAESEEQLSGAVVVRDDPMTGDIVVGVDINPQASSIASGIDRVFVLQRKDARPLGEALEIGDATVWSSSAGIVIRDTQTPLTIALTLPENRAAVAHEIGTGSNNLMLVGHGLSRRHVSSERSLASFRSESIGEFALGCENKVERGLFNRSSQFAAILIGPDEDNQQYCSSGGLGSKSCSTSCIGGNSCSVSCTTGYYACCDKTSCNCRCVAG